MWSQYYLGKRNDDLINPKGRGSTLLNALDANHWLKGMQGCEALKHARRTCDFVGGGESQFVIAKIGTRSIVEMSSIVRNLLGADHPFSKELLKDEATGAITPTGRRIQVNHVYGTEGGKKFPDFEEFQRVQKADMLHILNEAHKGEVVPTIDMPLREFAQPRKAGTEWDRVASEIEAGKHEGKAAVFNQDGKLVTWVELAQKEQAHGTAPSGATTQHASPASNTHTAARAGTQKSWVESLSGNKRAMLITGVSLGAVIGGYALWHQLNRKEEKTQPSR